MSDPRRTYDELLVLQCQEADPDAFDELLSRWQKPLWQHAWRLIGREAAAWDVLQDALVAISSGIGKLDHPGAFRTWAYRIVTYKCRDWIRRENRRREAHASLGASLEPRGPDCGYVEGHLSKLKDAIERLPGKDRALLALKYESGFDTEEIALILDVPPGTVKSRLYHARKRLKSIMEETDHDGL